MILNNIIPITYVNNNLSPDFFIFNNLIAEGTKPMYSAIVFSPLAFGKDEETEFIINKFKANEYYVKELTGKEASVFNIDHYIKEFPYEVFHICSHGGEVDGYTRIEDFIDRDGNSHTVEYDEVVSFAPHKSEENIQVSSVFIFRKFDGLIWKSKELSEKEYEKFVFVDMLDHIKNIKRKKGKKNNNILDSSHIKCSDFNYQPMFNIIAGSHTNPLIFNNTCFSWSDISDSFLNSGARGYIGTLWSIKNVIAKEVAETFYTNIFDGTILDALQKGLIHTNSDSDFNVYIYWGLHFSSIQSGVSLSESRINITKKILYSIDRWIDHKDKEKNVETRSLIDILIRWNVNQLYDFFQKETYLLYFKKL